MPYAVVQLRQENLRADSYNLVGFQNHLKFGEQARVLRLIPGLENAKFLRYGQIHRNTYINGPTLLSETLQMKQHPNVIFAGQISGVEGYVESIATGLLAGMHAAALAAESRARSASARDRLRRAGELHLPRRREEFPAGEHHFRFAAATRRGHPPPRPRQEAAARDGVRAGAGGIAGVAGKVRVNRGAHCAVGDYCVDVALKALYQGMASAVPQSSFMCVIPSGARVQLVSLAGITALRTNRRSLATLGMTPREERGAFGDLSLT